MAMIKATGCAFNLDEMFMNFPYNKLELSCEDCQKINNNPHKDKLVKKIFRECMKMILNDVIDNNITFQLPTGKKKCDIHMTKIQGDAFKNLRKSGKWNDVDMMSSDFTGYQLGFYMYGERDPRVKTIYINKQLKDKITQNTNNGMQYC